MASNSDRAIAIVAVGAILPDAPNAPAFWQNIKNKRYSIIETPPERWSIADYYDPDPAARDKTYSKIGGWVRGFTFDWQRFRIPPKVAAAMDPGQQWAVTICAEALADYGYPDRPLNTENTGVVLGTAMGGELHYVTSLRINFPEFAHSLESVDEFSRLPADVRAAILAHAHAEFNRRLPQITEDTMPGELPNIVAGRVANVLNLRGPSFITDAACASTFAAVDAAVDLLAEGHCDAVLTGGVDRNMGASVFVKFCKIGALSATGTRPFGDGADGFVMGEGSASFLLKRLADAERDGDKIYAVIRGVGASSDGKGKGITAPNPLGQVLATTRAWKDAGLDPATATMVEAHGTSTRVGDVVEVESLTKVFGGAERGSIALGSVKSNIGHLKAGAGAAGLLKTVMALHEKVLPPTLNSEKPNPNIDFNATPFYLNHEVREWEKRSSPRRAGVSAYGFGGTNFHVVLEEYTPGMIRTESNQFTGASFQGSGIRDQGSGIRDQGSVGQAATSRPPPPDPRPLTRPPRGILVLGAATPVALKDALDETFRKVEGGWTPPVLAPDPADLKANERLVFDFGSHDELLDRIVKARKAMGFDNPQAWKALQAQGVFRGSGPAPGKIAFLFPGQGSQYANMGRELVGISPSVAAVFEEADRVMTPILGKPLTSYIFIDSSDSDAIKRAEKDLTQTAITQPAMLTLDTAMYKLLADYGFAPDMVMGHSLGEYGALVASGIMPFAHSLEAAAARGAEMTKVSMDDNGWMAAVMAPIDVIKQTLAEIDGYVVAANINSYNQAVVGGASKAVEQAIEVFTQKGYQAQRIPVSHAFHTRIVAPASKPLRQVLNRLHIAEPKLPLVANVTGELYPTTVEAIKDILELQIASPVQWVKGLETLYANGCRTFVEVGPKKALKGFVDDVLGAKPGVVSLFTNHPKTGELQSFNHALCGLYAAGYGTDDRTGVSHTPSATNDERRTTNDDRRGVSHTPWATDHEPRTTRASIPVPQTARVEETHMTSGNGQSVEALGAVLAQALQALNSTKQGPHTAHQAFDRNDTPLGSVVISGTGLGLPGAEKPLMDEGNALRILRGEQFIDLIPERFRRLMANKRVTRVVKAEDGGGSFETIEDTDDVIKLAGRPGSFNLAEEYGVPEKLIEALDTTTQISIAAGLDALREAGIPLVQTYRRTTTGRDLPDRWMLPEAMRDETGVIFASAFPGYDRLADEFNRYYVWENRQSQLNLLEELRATTAAPDALAEISRRANELREALEREPYTFDRRFLFRILAFGHAQFAEYIGARGPNTHVNAACAGTTQGIALAEDWIRTGRCRRVLVIAGDNVTSDNLIEWIGAGFLVTGAAATDDKVEEAALPFDRRRHGMLMGMGACALVVESEDAVRERGMRGIVEVLSTESSNSAFHGTRLDITHISQVMNQVVTAAERRFGLDRRAMAAQTVFMSHETYTPARGGSASAEIAALRHTFGDAANQVIISNTKGFTGHPMGVGIEDVIALKILEYGIVPPVPNIKEIDPELGALNLSRGGRYPVRYALHLAAGFGSQIAISLTRRIPGAPDRVESPARYQRWLADVSGYDRAEAEVVKRVLRIKAQGAPTRQPAPSDWHYGTGPVVRAASYGNGVVDIDDRRPTTDERQRTEDGGRRTEDGGRRAKDEGRRTEDEGRRTKDERRPLSVATNGGVTQTMKDERRETEDERRDTQHATRTRQDESRKTQVEPAAPAVAAVQAPAAEEDHITKVVLRVVAEKTGYPQDMLDLDLDLEADLGVDTVKQAETFLAVREVFNIPQQENLRLRDYPTLASVVGFVRARRPDLVRSQESGVRSQEITPQAPVAPTPPPPYAPTPADPVAEKVRAIVAEKTGYPQEMLDLDLDMEADLGVDTVKQAETFLAVREAFDIPRQDDLKLRDYPTLASVIEFVYKYRPDLVRGQGSGVGGQGSGIGDQGSGAGGQEAGVGAPSTAVTPTPLPPYAPTPADPVAEQVLAIVADKTGYPQEMLDLDLDMEADLGIDTVKQAETFMAIREAFGIPRQDDLKLRDYPTLASVIEFVYTNRPDLVRDQGSGVGGQEVAVSGQPSAVSPQPATGQPEPSSSVLRPSSVTTIGTLADADSIPRRVPVPSLRPALEFCKPTGVTLDGNTRVVVMMDRGGVGRALLNRLDKRGVGTLVIDEPLTTEDLELRLKGWLAEGPIQGVYWLPALDVEPGIEEMDLAIWRELNRQRVKNLYTTMRTLYETVSGPGAFLVSATRLGGLHGYTPEGATAPLGGAVVGFTKAYKREKGDTLVKAVDFEAGRKTAEPAEALIAETLFDPGIVEIGYFDGLRYTVTLEEQPAADGQPGMVLNKETVFVVTGAAGGITSAIVADLAVASGGVFYLLDLVPLPERNNPDIALFRTDKEALKRKLFDAMKAAGERPTPVAIDKRLLAIEREEAALRAVETVEAAGGTAHYHSVNLMDGAAVTAVVDDIRSRYGRIDVLLHAGGLEISRMLPDKEPREFNLVFDVKADGFFSLLNAAKGLPIGATVSFSSVAGRFGNSGQADYSSANDLLCKISSSMRTWRPETRGIVIDWTAWGGIGMATRGSIPQIMERAGIDMLPPEGGVPTIRRELTYGGTRNELVVGKRLGILVAEFDPTGGLDVEKANAAAQGKLMVGKIVAAKLYGGLEVETTLDPKEQAFLFDHQIDKVPVLPGVMGTEAFAELATTLAGVANGSSFNVAAVKVQFQSPFKFHRNQPRTLYLSATARPGANGEIIARTMLRSVTQPKPEMPAQVALHFTGDVQLAHEAVEQPTVEFTPPATEALGIDQEQIYQVYFHGPAYQVLERVGVEANQAVALMADALLPDTASTDTVFLVAPRLIELCFQAAGIWEAASKGRLGLPLAYDTATVYRRPEDAGGQRLYALVTPLNGGEAYDVQVVDAAGNVYVTVKGYRTVVFQEGVQL